MTVRPEKVDNSKRKSLFFFLSFRFVALHMGGLVFLEERATVGVARYK
jgi:hypothetical protein